jgi:hypothetical protein
MLGFEREVIAFNPVQEVKPRHCRNKPDNPFLLDLGTIKKPPTTKINR